ncbi:MAG: carbohydrate ABC transporter permease [Bifidobacteriaceae bacterium]|jgi:glucose/mannose transport system permease protein|nr:carbohydrate ABC transporter permease [Bifidobacteriaceae bacterium]
MTTTALTGHFDATKVPEAKKPNAGFDWGRLIRYGLLLLFLVIVLIPVYVLLVTSFKGVGDADPSRAWLPPQEWTLENWKVALLGSKSGEYGKIFPVLPALGRTLAMVVPAAIISSFLGSMNGFVLARWRFPYANVVFTLILFGMFIPYQAVMVPLYKIMIQMQSNWGLPSGIPTLALLHIIYGIPITTLIFRNYYQSVPQELMEASRVDGAGMIRTYVSVVLPISIPSFVVVLIWQFTSAWNDFLFASFFGGNAETQAPVTVTLNAIAHGSMMTNYGVSMAAALLASVPTLVVYIFLGKYFVGGLMSGSVKG